MLLWLWLCFLKRLFEIWRIWYRNVLYLRELMIWKVACVWICSLRWCFGGFWAGISFNESWRTRLHTKRGCILRFCERNFSSRICDWGFDLFDGFKRRTGLSWIRVAHLLKIEIIYFCSLRRQIIFNVSRGALPLTHHYGLYFLSFIGFFMLLSNILPFSRIYFRL